jgi:hypothetical protein
LRAGPQDAPLDVVRDRDVEFARYDTLELIQDFCDVLRVDLEALQRPVEPLHSRLKLRCVLLKRLQFGDAVITSP